MKMTLARSLFALAAMCGAVHTWADVRPPHTLKVSTHYDNVSLSWLSPTADKELKWHSGRDYNGDTAPAGDPQQSVMTWSAAMFTPADLIDNIGDQIEAISVFHYRQVIACTVFVYCDDHPVAQGKCDMTKWAKNTWERVTLDRKVTIEAGKEYKLVARYEHGSNVDFVAIKDEASDAPGRGDLFSTDGKTWTSTAGGEYLITGHLAKTDAQEPDSYNVLVDGKTVANVTATDYTVEGITGTHTYAVATVSGAASAATKERTLTTAAYSSYLPAVNISKAANTDFDVNLEWRAPLLGGNKLTWSTGVKTNSIGGTASSNTKVWVRNLFSASDLHAYGPDAAITAINMHFAESVMSAVTLWIMKDGALVYSQAVDALTVAGIKAGDWTSFPLRTPFKLEPGHEYAYGLYVLHTPKTHPISCDDSQAVSPKGNAFSTSSANSSDFLKSKPSWKTLAQGGIPGNWMLSADVTSASSLTGALTYDVACNGTVVAEGLATPAWQGSVPGPGRYEYTVTTRSAAGTSSLPATAVLDVALPSAYSAPLLSDATFDNATKQFALKWSMDKELVNCGDAAYTAGFDEEMTMMWGTQFAADRLKAYAGGKITSLKIAVGDQVQSLGVGVYTPKGKALAKVAIADGEIDPLTFYTVTLPEPVAIDGTTDLLLAYDGTIPAGSGAMILDAGPLVSGGARVSFTGGANWNNLGTVNATYNNYNIVISAIVSFDDATGTRQVELTPLRRCAAAKADSPYGVETAAPLTAPQAKAPAVPRAKSFNVYCNGTKVATTTATSYQETVKRYGRSRYHVTAVYENDWESAASKSVTVNNTIAQKAEAPYGLDGQLESDHLTLTWQSPAAATRLSYITAGERAGLGLNSSAKTIDSYAVIKFPADQLTDHLGKTIDHISFGLLSTDVNSLSVIVLKGENIIYSQSVPVASLVVGDNDVRLNEPVEIVAGCDMAIGYMTNYAVGVKPLGTDTGAAVAGFGDLVSSSGSPGYWYSLKTKFKIDQNWWITGILKARDAYSPIFAADASDITYNVYCDGQLIKSGLTATTCRIDDLSLNSKFHVTAVTPAGESGESNYYYFTPSGITDITADSVAGDTEARYYNLLGIEADRDNIAPGIYIRRTATSSTKVLVR